MTAKKSFLDIVDAARSGDFEPLDRALWRFVPVQHERHADAAVNASLWEIKKKFDAGVPSTEIARQLRGIVRNQAAGVARSETRAQRHLLPDESFGEADRGDPSEDPAIVLADLEALDESIAFAQAMKEKSPRRFEIVAADYLGEDAKARLQAVSDKPVTDTTVWKTRQRAHETAEKLRKERES